MCRGHRSGPQPPGRAERKATENPGQRLASLGEQRAPREVAKVAGWLKGAALRLQPKGP